MTSHKELFKRQTLEREELLSSNPVVWYSDGYDYQVFECQGCHNVVMRKAFWSSELTPDEYHESYISWHPPIASRQIPKWQHELPADTSRLLREIYQGLHAGSYSLALMGLRAVLDLFIVRKIGDIGTFEAKLSALVRDGYLSTEQRKLVEPTLDVGSAVAHRGHEPSGETTVFVLDVVEAVLQQEILQSRVEAVTSQTPQRPARPRKTTK